MTTETHQYDGCIICAVRAMTEGKPPVWHPENVGDQVSGVVLRKGQMPTEFLAEGRPTLDLWTGTERIRVIGFGTWPISLGGQIDAAEIQVGDTVTVARGEDSVLKSRDPALNGRPYKTFIVDVIRGHH